MSTSEAVNAAAPTPARIWDISWAYGRARVLATAVELKLFDYLAEKPLAAAEVAKAAKLSTRGVRMVFDALVGLELLTKTKEGYSLGDDARVFLVGSSPAYMGDIILHSADLSKEWENLSSVVRSGKPSQSVEREQQAREFFPRLVAALFTPSFGASRLSRAALPARVRKNVKSILDVASGSAAWSLAWATENPDVRVTAVDFPEMHTVARQYTDCFGVTDRYTFRDGNIRKVNFGAEKFDLVILGHICHSEGEKYSIKLIQKSAKALKPGGLLLIAEMVPNDQRTGPVGPLLFGLNMLVNTEVGDVFTLAEYRKWMKDAGLSSVRKLNLGPSGPDIIVGERK